PVLRNVPALLKVPAVPPPRVASFWARKVAVARLFQTALLVSERPPVPVQVTVPGLSRVRPASVLPPVPLMLMPAFGRTCPPWPPRGPPVQLSRSLRVKSPRPERVPPDNVKVQLRVEGLVILKVPPDMTKGLLLVRLWMVCVPVLWVTVTPG